MAKKSPKHGSSKSQTRSNARSVAAEGRRVRERVKELSVHAFTNGQMKLRDLPKLVGEVLDGAAEGVDKSIPKAASNVLREVFDGLREGVHTIASAGSSAASDVREGASEVLNKDASHLVKQAREAHDDFLDAVQKFGQKASHETREQLDSLVARARRTAPRVEESVRRAAKAADGRVMELTGETARAGVRAVRNAAGILAMGAGGMLEGLAEAILPREGKKATSKTKSKPAKSTAKKSSTKKARTTTKKPAKKSSKKKGKKPAAKKKSKR